MNEYPAFLGTPFLLRCNFLESLSKIILSLNLVNFVLVCLPTKFFFKYQRYPLKSLNLRFVVFKSGMRYKYTYVFLYLSFISKNLVR